MVKSSCQLVVLVMITGDVMLYVIITMDIVKRWLWLLCG